MNQYCQRLRSEALRLPVENGGFDSEAEATTGTSSDDFGLLLGPLSHRTRNLLAVVEDVIWQTQLAPAEEYRAELLRRLSVLRHSHDIATRSSRIELAALLEQITARVGPAPLRLSPGIKPKIAIQH